MDPALTTDGKPYGPKRYESIVKERYLISKRLNTSYIDTANISPLERGYLIKWILEEIKAEQEAMAKQRAQMEAQKPKRGRRR